MSSPRSVPGPTRRLAEQMQAVSEVTETLTLRLLELEERLAAHELRLRPLLEAAAGLDPAGMEDLDLRLGDTEDRIARIEAILGGFERPGAARHLRSLQGSTPAPSLQQDPLGFHAVPGAEDSQETDFAAEEEEQLFMDERIA